MFAGEPDAGNLQVRFDEGEWQARVQRSYHSLLYWFRPPGAYRSRQLN
jgi:hypothetical protein